jgi:chemotaxis protein CheX
MREEAAGLNPEIAPAGAQPVVGPVRDKLLEPFIAAVCAALGEMASSEVVVQAVYQTALHPTLGDLVAVVGLMSTTEEFLVLSFPEPTAAAIAGRILAGSTEAVDANLTSDCLGEVANVVAGQAKALLAETPYHFAFSMPRVVGHEFQPPAGLVCLTVTFRSDLGDFTMHLFLKL